MLLGNSLRKPRLSSKAPTQKFSSVDQPQARSSGLRVCDVVSVGKRRDGGTRYWCLQHKADATAKYGKPSEFCRAAHLEEIHPRDVFKLNLDDFPGGVALWGAVPPIYDTTEFPMERGIHVHARKKAGKGKEIDGTFRGVRIIGAKLPKQGIFISEIDSIYYMASSVFGLGMHHVVCSYCKHPHLDKDWFSVHPHRRHLCAGCGKHFRDDKVSIGNPICGVREACGVRDQDVKPSKDRLVLRQRDFPAGIQIWGSNPALLWTGSNAETEGIHVHAFKKAAWPPEIDETFSSVSIDGVPLDARMVRVLMAQESLPSLKGRVASLDCPNCAEALFETGALSYSPAQTHACERCGKQFPSRGRLRKIVGNPLVEILAKLGISAPRARQLHDLQLLPETL